MVTLPVTFSDPNPQTTPIFTFYIAFHTFVVGEHRDFEFGVNVDYSKSEPMNDKLSLGHRVVTSHDPFQIVCGMLCGPSASTELLALLIVHCDFICDIILDSEESGQHRLPKFIFSIMPLCVHCNK